MTEKIKRGDVLQLKSNGQDVAVVTVNESGHRVRSLDVVDVKGKAMRVKLSEVIVHSVQDVVTVEEACS